MTRDEAVEVAARILAKEDGYVNWDRDLMEAGRNAFRRKVRSALSDIEAAGLALVPREPTESMLIAGGDRQQSRTYYPSDVWSAMLAAGEVK